MNDHHLKTLEDHERRIRYLERSGATDKKVDEIEARVRRLEVTMARIWVLVLVSSAAGSGGVALIQALMGQ